MGESVIIVATTYALRSTRCPECGAFLLNRPLFAFFSIFGVNKHICRSIFLAIASVAMIIVTTVFLYQAWYLLRLKHVELIVPNGYRGDVLIVKDSEGVVATSRDGAYYFVVPDSGVLRVRDIDLFTNFVGTPSDHNKFTCREVSGMEFTYGANARNVPTFSLNGPMGKARITVLSIGDKLLRDRRYVDPETLRKFWQQGVPLDYVAPHVIVEK